MNPSRYIDPTSDFGFKRLFANESNKDLLLNFLNAVFRGEKVITDFQINKNEHVGDHVDSGSVVLDLTCVAADGSYLLIEVQHSAHKNFKQRMVYYGSKLIADQAPKGDRGSWNYSLKEVYIIVIMDGFSLAADKGKIIQDIAFYDTDTAEVFYPHYRYLFISLSSFKLGAQSLKTELDGWLYLLKNASKMKQIPKFLKKPIFLKWFEIAEYINLNTEERNMYNQSLKNKWDKASTIAYAREDGEAKGLAKGEAKGYVKGVADGEAKGFDKGEAKGYVKGVADGEAKGFDNGVLFTERNLALKLKAQNVPLEIIAISCNLTLEEIEKLS